MNEEHIDVLIVGAGISGIGAGYYLKINAQIKALRFLNLGII